MKLDLSEESLPVYEALASSVRLHPAALACREPNECQGIGRSGKFEQRHYDNACA